VTTQLTPITYALTLGTTSVQILPSNPSRKALMFFNPTANIVAICPAVNSLGGPQVAIVNGAGSINITQLGLLIIPGPGWPDNVGLGTAFQAIASAPSTPFTVWEF